MIPAATSFQQATLYYRATARDVQSVPIPSPADNFDKRSFVRNLDAFSAYFKNLSEKLTETVNVKRLSKLDYASVKSSAALDLADVTTPTTLRSTESINTGLTYSYSPAKPDYTGSSSAGPEITGDYNGSLEDDTLTFTVTQPGNVGKPYTGPNGDPATLELEVRTSNGTLVDTLSFSESEKQNTPFALSMGISVEFDKGSLVLGDSFSVDLSSQDIETANPKGSMRLEPGGTTKANFDDGLFVVDGTFELNGEIINVGAQKNIYDVVNEINASAAGVTASYNSVTDEFELTQNTLGAAGEIVLANDTSGFLDAVKLSDAVAVKGTDTALDAKIIDVPELSNLNSGQFFINGVSISIDITQDSLKDVFNRINESGAEATVTFAGGFLSLRSTRVDLGLQIQDNGTNFFDVFSMQVGYYEGENSDRITGLRIGAKKIQKEFGKLDLKLSDLILNKAGEPIEGDANAVKSSLKSSALTALKNTLDFDASGVDKNGIVDTGLGITFDFTENADSLIEVNFNKLLDGLPRNPSRLMKFIFQEETQNQGVGLLETFADQLDYSKKSLANTLGVNSGINLDVFA